MFFKQSAMTAILFLKMKAKNEHRYVFIAIKIPCKFDEDICIN